MTSIFGTDHRNAACWSAGRLRPADMALIRRLHTQATTAVVPTMMGNVFEADHVLAAACFALVSQARDAAGMRATAEGVIAFHSRDLSGQPGAGGPGQLAPSPELREAARQARAWLDGVEVEPGRRPTRSLQLPYRPHAER